MMLSAVGLNHKTAPLTLRERAAVSRERLGKVLGQVRDAGGLTEAVLLSTCNRCELYMVTESRRAAVAAFAEFAAARGIHPDELTGTMMVVHDGAAALHVIRVASGLESMIVGEPQILGQVRRAHSEARQHGTAGPILSRLMQTAVGAGRRVRQATGLSQHAVSVPRAAAALTERGLGSLRGRSVVIVGAGEIAALAAKAFADRGGRIAAVCNRTVEAAELLAGPYGAAVFPLRALPEALRDAAVVVVALGGEGVVLPAALFDGPGHPLLIADLSVPRAVAADVATISGVRLFAVDDLGGAVTAAPAPADLATAEAMTTAAASGFLRWLASRAAAPLIAALTARAAQIAEQELRRAQPRLAGLNEGQREIVRRVVFSTMRKLLHAPVVRLREATADAPTLLSAASELFDINPDPDDGNGHE